MSCIPVQAAFVKHDACNCGFCTPGMVMSCAALSERNPSPGLHDVKHVRRRAISAAAELPQSLRGHAGRCPSSESRQPAC